jgi:hypothetical protein
MNTPNLILIRSIDRINPEITEAHNCKIEMSDTLNGRYKVQSILFPHNHYNVQQNFNDKVYWNQATDGDLVSTLTPGQYSTSTLASHLATVMSASSTSSTITVSYNTITHTYQFTSGTGNIYFMFGTYSVYSARSLLGFKGLDTTAASVIVSPDIADLNATHSLILNIKECKEAIVSTNGIIGSLYIPITTSWGQFIHHSPEVTHGHTLTFEHTSHLTITVLDQYNRIINLNNGEFQILIQRCSNY